MLEPPGSYCAYACMYITACLIKIFTLATNTFEEQHLHIMKLQQFSATLINRSQKDIVAISTNLNGDQYVQEQQWSEFNAGGHSPNPMNNSNNDDFYGQDDGPFFIDGQDLESNHQHPSSPMKSRNPLMSPRSKNRIKKISSDNPNNLKLADSNLSGSLDSNTGIDFNSIVKDNLNTVLYNSNPWKNDDNFLFDNNYFQNKNSVPVPNLARSKSNEEEDSKNHFIGNKTFKNSKDEHANTNAFYLSPSDLEENQPLLEKTSIDPPPKLSLAIVNPVDISRQDNFGPLSNSRRKNSGKLAFLFLLFFYLILIS